MPGYERAELTAQLRVVTAPGAPEGPPQEQLAAARRAAAETGLASEGGPETVMLAGSREEVLEGVRRIVKAALDAGAREVEVRVEAQPDAPRFGGKEGPGREDRDG
ncbi:hypothetical protein Rxycam_01699 [Rubrobacter xylanophilus DSM 9941]|uniref:hypothetical protein n=1 Tax=Rubrobacter xylanophilus TaxID=49319 RepID=UPI001C642752|nr:hypothetical protein [Rubrobacter xylanophilus]QYJ15871.1 hypothetical protein Rxycam_01699 [Rubrobacter xylanophilus DSM 9941]